ncbi:unnamed protein product, partial [Phytomonas sp. Hart1]
MDHLRGVLLRVQCNSLGFPFTAAETLGWSLQQTICMLNHSCAPNLAIFCADDATEREGVWQYLTGKEARAGANSPEEDRVEALLRGCMAVKALRDIAQYEELTLSYVDLEQLGDFVEERSLKLEERYRFTCACSLCREQRRYSWKRRQ